MHEMQTIVTDVRGDCSSVCHANQFGFFGVNTPGGPWNIVLDEGPDPPQRREGKVGKICQFWTLYISQERLKLDT